MTQTDFDLVLKNGVVWTPGGPADISIAVHDGRIAALGDQAIGGSEQEIDLKGLTVLPGVIDTQVHFREPGMEHKEDIETGTRAAALGGVTCVFEMPNTRPPTITPDAIADKLDRARGRAWVDHAFFIGASADNASRLEEWERISGCAGVKVFMGSSTGNLLVDDEDTLRQIMAHGHRRLAAHCEDERRLRERHALIKGGGDVGAHPLWRDEETALRATRRLVALAEAANRRVHVLHVTTAEEMAFLARHKTLATVEVTPQHLTLAAEDTYDRLGTRAQMNPPIRDRCHRDALWQAVTQGVVDVIGSDHAPHTLEEKAKPYPSSPSGMPGVQTLVPILLTHVARGRMSLAHFIDLTSAGAVRVYSLLGKGRIAVGYDADFTIVDMKKNWTITDDWIASRVGWTPFDSFKATGAPIHTIVRGHLVTRDGALQGTPIGAPARFGC